MSCSGSTCRGVFWSLLRVSVSRISGRTRCIGIFCSVRILPWAWRSITGAVRGNKLLCAIAIVVSWAFANLHFFSYQIQENPASPALACVIIFNVLLVAFFLLSGMTASGKWRIFDRKAGGPFYPGLS